MKLLQQECWSTETDTGIEAVRQSIIMGKTLITYATITGSTEGVVKQ